MTTGADRPTVVIVGAGMAGLVAARHLDAFFRVVVVDKGRGVGGRMATRRIDGATLDHGAQFITTHTESFAAMMGDWVEAGVAASWFRGRVGPDGVSATDGHTRYRGVISMNAIAKYLATGLDVRTASLVSAIGVRSDQPGWILEMAEGPALDADAVIATAPVPQTMTLLDNGGVALSTEDAAALGAVAYEPCLALMVVLDGPSGLDGAGAVDPESGPIDWLADNAVKGISAVPAVTIHATAEFSRQRWESSEEEIARELLDAAGLDAAPVAGAITVQRWRYARPSVVHPDAHLRLAGFAPFVCAGDAFGGAKVEGAALSGASAARAVLDALEVQS